MSVIHAQEPLQPLKITSNEANTKLMVRSQSGSVMMMLTESHDADAVKAIRAATGVLEGGQQVFFNGTVTMAGGLVLQHVNGPLPDQGW